jgi:ABC-2 type transport system ATP-binding protein
MIDVREVTKAYGTHIALAGVSLSIDKGEAFALLGPNGAGKSTLVKLISTLSRPDHGAITVASLDTVTEAARVRRHVEVVFQENNIDRDLTPRQNLVFHARLRRLSGAEEKVADLLDRLGLSAWADRPVQDLSGGMRRRLVIGRALLSRPDVLLLDEPTTGLDPAIRRELWQLIRTVHAEGCTIVLTTHYIEEAEALCSRVAIINHGRIMAEGAPARLVAQFEVDTLEDVVVSLGGAPCG